jgi:hypothetical protein
MKAGDYHSGPLSILVPFGVVGSVGLISFFFAAIRVLVKNMKYGDPDIKNINVLLFSYFVGRLIFFIVFFGGIEGDLWLFCSIVGVSLSVNGGVMKPSQARRAIASPSASPSRQQAELIPA